MVLWMCIIILLTRKRQYKLVSDQSSAERWSEVIGAYKTFLDIGREYGVEKLPKNQQSHIEQYEKTLVDNSFFDFYIDYYNHPSKTARGMLR